MDIKKKIKNYYSNKSKFSIASDIVFVVLLIALLFPSSRMLVMSTIQRITLFQPDVKEEKAGPTLSGNAYQWGFKTLQGEEVALSQFKGEVIFLNFWATWCPPCVAEMPTIQDLYGQYKDDVAFVLVSNEKTSVIKNFLDKNEYSIPSYKGIYQPPEALQTQTLPTTFLIAKDGRIAIRKEGSAKWDGSKVKKKVEQLLNE